MQGFYRQVRCVPLSVTRPVPLYGYGIARVPDRRIPLPGQKILDLVQRIVLRRVDDPPN